MEALRKRLRRRVPTLVLDGHVEWGVSIHDDHQVELHFDYVVQPSTHGVIDTHEDARPRFDVDVHLLVPSALAIDTSSYPKEQFFADMTHRMRLYPPDVASFRACRIPALDEYLALELDLDAKVALAPRVVQEVKLFANYINRQLKETFDGDEVRDGLTYKRDLRDTERLVRKYAERYVAKVEPASLLIGTEVRSAVLTVSSYLHDRMERVLSRAALAGTEKAERVLAKRYSTGLSAEQEIVSPGADELEVERYYQRISNLKKYVSEVLYLQPERIRTDRVYRNLVAAGGAALAATFAETARYYNTISTGTADFGFRFAFFIAIAVVAYVFKDRIKDLTKEYFGRRVDKRLPDRDTIQALHFVDPDRVARKVPVVRHHEIVHHTTSRALEDDVAYLWGRMTPDRHQSKPRDVLDYLKSTWIEPECLGELGFDELAVKDIVRLDTSAFLSHFDNPSRELAVYDSEEGAVVLSAPKVYYLDAVLRIACEFGPPGDRTRNVRFEAFRLVLDKGGIIRLDRPIPEGRYHYRADVA